MDNKRRNTQQSNAEWQKKIPLFRAHADEKREIILRAIEIERLCDYDAYDNLHQRCELEMEDLFRQWKAVGSAGREDERLWRSFSAVKDRFWKGIKLVKLKDRILDMSCELDDLRDDFDFTHKPYLLDRIDRKEDKISDLQWEIEQLEEELGING